MRRWGRVSLAWIAGALVAAGCATGGRPTGWEEAARSARLNRQTPSARVFQSNVARKLAGPLERAGRKCAPGAPDTRRSQILYRLDASGARVETLVYPDTALARCIEQEIRDVELLAPPEPDYWIAVETPAAISRDLHPRDRRY